MNYQPLFNALCDLGANPPLQTEMDHIIEICEGMNPKVKASRLMYQALSDLLVEQNDAPLERRIQQWENALNAAAAALAMADNTNETL